jgi:gamma-carbonic anhydrase
MLTSLLSARGAVLVLRDGSARLPERGDGGGRSRSHLSPFQVYNRIMITSYKGISPNIADTAFVAAGAQIIGDVHLGAHSSVWFNCVLRGDCFYIRIGENTNIQDNTVIHVTQERFATVIGNRVTVGHSAVLHGCTVKDRCLIGIGAIVLDDVIVGEESFIAAGSLVTPGTVIPPRSMVMGAPAKVRRQVTDAEVARIDEHWRHYIEYKNQYLAEGKRN